MHICMQEVQLAATALSAIGLVLVSARAWLGAKWQVLRARRKP